MENHVPAQLQLLGLSVLLGAASASVYDMLRALRLRCRRPLLTQLLDGLFVVLLALALAAFGRGLGGGEVRLYALLHMGLGAVLYFLLAAPLLRPLWQFWTEVAARLARLAWLPVAQCLKTAKFFAKITKKLFHFLRRYATIVKYKWEFIPTYWRIHGKGGRVHGEKGKDDQERSQLHHHAGAGGAGGRYGHRADPDVRQAPHRAKRGGRHRRSGAAAPPGK